MSDPKPQVAIPDSKPTKLEVPIQPGEFSKKSPFEAAPDSAGSPQKPECCPSCQAIDNNPYIDANGVHMRACGRCMIQWRETRHDSEAAPPEMIEVPPEAWTKFSATVPKPCENCASLRAELLRVQTELKEAEKR
jgi:hypothetical protein